MPMEHRTKRDAALINLVSDFESNFESGNLEYLDDKAIHQLLQYYEEDGQVDKAIEVVNIAIEQYQYRSDFYIIKARLLLMAKKTKECFETIEYVQNVAPYEAELPLIKAKALALSGQYAAAQDLITQIKAKALTATDTVEALLCESYVHELMKHYDSMYETLVEAIRIDPNNNDVLRRLWKGVEHSRNYKASIDLHKEILDQYPYSYLAWYNLGHAYSSILEYEMAIEAMEYSFIINPYFEDGYEDCAELAITIQDYEKALQIFEEALEKLGQDSDLLVSLAQCLMFLGRIPEAKRRLFKSIRLDNYNDQAYYHLGQCYYQEEKWFSAINAYHKALEIEENIEDYYLALAKAYIKVEDYAKAAINFKHSTALAQDGYIYWFEYAKFLIKMGQYSEAISVLDDSEEVTWAAELQYCKAIAFFFLKEKQDGLQCLEDALLENYTAHPIIFELAPELEVNNEIQAMIKYYMYEE